MTFALDIAAFAEETGLELELVTRKLALDGYTRITEKTPVDTGRARANWNIGVGQPDTQLTDTDADTGIVDAPSRPTLRKGDGENAIFITNNLPYINELENGSSKQTPRGMVAVTMLELEAGMRNVLR
jgi:hypothetical protein